MGQKALRLELTAGAAWVKRQGWDYIADYLEGDNLLQVPVQVEGVTMTLTAWWKEERLNLCNMNVLKGALSEIGSAHKACGSLMTLWAHLSVDNMWGIAREWATLFAFSAFRGEGRHRSLKSQIKKGSFNEESKKRGSRLQGARRALRKAGAEVLLNDNLDWGWFSRGFNVWQPSWTRQEAFLNAKQYWERLMRKGKS